MLTDFQNFFADRLSNKFLVIRYFITPQTRRYTTSWNCCVQKSQWPGGVSRELPCKTQPFKTSAEKYLPSDVSIISVHWQKDIYSGRTENPIEWLTECICINQEERRRDKTPAHKINVQSLTASVGEAQVVDSTHYISLIATCRSRSQD